MVVGGLGRGRRGGGEIMNQARTNKKEYKDYYFYSTLYEHICDFLAE